MPQTPKTPQMPGSTSDHDAFPQTATRAELLVNGGDQTLRQLLYELTALSARIETMRAQFSKRLGITPPQYSLLYYVAQHQGDAGLTLNQVAHALHVSGPHVTKEANALVHLGLLQKHPNPADGRSQLLRTTAKSDRAIAELAPVLRDVNDTLFGALDQQQFVDFAAAVAATLHEADRTLAKLPYFLDRP